MLPFLKNKFKKARDTLILSDLHLTTAEPEHPKKTLWKKFNRKEYFIDQDFSELLLKAQANMKKGIELILAGDIFDFDSVLSIPTDPPFSVSWLEKKRGLNSEEPKSVYKIEQIIREHPVFFQALQEFVANDNKVIFIFGNHDLELHWPTVQEKILHAICPTETNRDNIRFCHWFYVSNSDTLIEHGNQYDSYCSIMHPMSPFFKHLKNPFIKLPFGNLTHRYMINGMGIFNPHVDSTYLLDFWGYMRFYLSTIKVQPFLLASWFFGAFATWIVSAKDALAPRIKNPLKLENIYNTIADTANVEPKVVRALREIHAHPVSWNVFKILRILWLDRAILLLFLVYASFQITGLLHILWGVSFYWGFPVLFLMMPLFVLYTWKVQTLTPETKSMITTSVLRDATQITETSRFVCGHSHAPESRIINGIEFLNAGYWSPSFKDINCTSAEKNKSFVWIGPNGKTRKAELLFWDDCKDVVNPFV